MTDTQQREDDMGFSIQHLILTLVIVILIFGTRRLSTLGADLGGAIRGFRKAVNDNQDNGFETAEDNSDGGVPGKGGHS